MFENGFLVYVTSMHCVCTEISSLLKCHCVFNVSGRHRAAVVNGAGFDSHESLRGGRVFSPCLRVFTLSNPVNWRFQTVSVH